jgi:hypothetical protein
MKTSIETDRRSAPRRNTSFSVDVQTNRWNPFLYQQGHLIDISVDGFKIKFQSSVKMKIGRKIKIKIYLLNSSKKYIKIAGIVKWVDEVGKKTGGIFIKNKETKKLETLCHSLEKKNAMS